MDNKELKAKLIAMRNAIEDYLDNIEIDSVDDKKTKKEKKEADNG